MSENAERLQAEIDLLTRQKQVLLVRADVLTKLTGVQREEIEALTNALSIARRERAELLKEWYNA